MIPFELSTNLNHTWFIDLDGTILEHEGLFEKGEDYLLPGAREFLNSIPPNDIIVITTAREEWTKEDTLKNLKRLNIRFNHIIFNLPAGERIVINDIKPRGLKTAIAWNVERNKGFKSAI